MNALRKNFLDTKTVAFGIGAPEKTLRNWIERDQYRPGGKKPAGRYEFSPYDLSVLAIAKRLVDFGVPVETAAYIADDALKNSAGFKGALRHQQLDNPGIFSAAQLASAVRVFKDKDHWEYNVIQVGDAADSSAFIEIHLGFVIRDALRRAGLLAAQEAK
jgi:DNA-binding transcriptional MerR regulator